MKKIICLLLLISITTLTLTAKAQTVTGFKKNGAIEATSEKIGVTIAYSDKQYPNGGQEVTVTYDKFETTSPYQPVTPYPVDTIKVKNTNFRLVVTGPTVDGSQQIAGANEIAATENEIIITRYLPEDDDPKTAVVTKYTFTKQRCVREIIYASGHKEEEQTLP